MNRALIIVDMQVDFVTGSLGTKEAERIVPAVVKKIETEKENGAQIIFTKDTHETNYLQTQEGRKLPVKHCIRQTEGWQIIPELKAYTSDAKIIEKPTFGSVELAKELIAANNLKVEGAGFGTDTNVLTLITEDGGSHAVGPVTSVTSAPRYMARLAIAYPIFPVE